jgi:hypothetical protein
MYSAQLYHPFDEPWFAASVALLDPGSTKVTGCNPAVQRVERRDSDSGVADPAQRSGSEWHKSESLGGCLAPLPRATIWNHAAQACRLGHAGWSRVRGAVGRPGAAISGWE